MMDAGTQREIEQICANFGNLGAPPQVVHRLRRILVEAATWRASSAAPPPSVARAIAGLVLKGFPQLAGEPMVFPFALPIAATGSAELRLKPRKPVWAIGLVSDQPGVLNTAGATTDFFEYAGDRIYPDAGEDSAGFIRVKDPEFFTFAALDSDASPWPMGMLLNDELGLHIQVTNPSLVAITWVGNVYAVSLREGDELNRLIKQAKALVR